MKHLARWSAAAAVFVPFLLAQDSDRFQVQLLAKGYTYTDGPAWSKDGFLIFSDTPADQLLKWVPGQPPQVYRENVQGPAGNAVDSQGRLYTCETRARSEEHTSELQSLRHLVCRLLLEKK